MTTRTGHGIKEARRLRKDAAWLLSKSTFTREDSARFDRLSTLAESIENAERHDTYTAPELERMHEFRSYLRNPQLQYRDMTEGAGGGYLAPVMFSQQAWAAAKMYDRLFDRDVVTFIETKNGNTATIPNFDDTSASAQQVSEGMQEAAQDLTVGELLLAIAPLWRSKGVLVSNELIQDQQVDLVPLLSRAFGIRFSRGIGASLVSTILSAATLGRTAVGSASNDGGSGTGTNTIGTDDLLALMGSVDPAYSASEKCGWLLNFATLIQILQIKDRQGHPIIQPARNENGDFVLFERPVYISPSMPSVATGNKTILFGDLGRIVVRVVGDMRVRVNSERFADFGKSYVNATTRANGGLQVTTGSDSPIKFLQQA